MNKLIAVVVIVLFLAGPGYAKTSAAGKSLTMDDMLAKLKVQLELTDEQIEKIKPIFADYMAKEKQLKLEEKKALSRVLTDEQLYTWNFLQNEIKEKKRSKL